MKKTLYTIGALLLLISIQGCSGNGFHLRKNVTLTPEYNTVYLQGLATKPEFEDIFTDYLAEAGSQTTKDEKLAKSNIIFTQLEEGRRVIAYTSDRVAREYLVYLKAEYSIRPKNTKAKGTESLPKHRLNIDRSYLYDPDFALGKAEEEKRVKLALYEEAARLILLRLKYSTQN